MTPEFCICAAIKMPDGEVIHGHRHNHCYDVVRARLEVSEVSGNKEKAERTRLEMLRAEQGFVTSTGRFVGREEAMNIQRTSGRPSKYRTDGQYLGDVLFSEDLY